MPDQWYYTHAGATCGPVSGVQLRGLIETDGIAPDDLVWPAGVAPTQAVRADAALAFPSPTPVDAADFQPAPPSPPDWLRELFEALAAVRDLSTLPPPPAKSWIADVRRAEQTADPHGKKPPGEK